MRRTFYLLTSIFIFVEIKFILIYTFWHKMLNYHFLLVPLLFCNVIGILFYELKKNYNQGMLINFSVAVLSGCILIYSAGGPTAPAPFMLGLLPISVGALFGSRYVLISVPVTLLLFSLVMWAGYTYPPPVFIPDYTTQKLINTVFFITTCCMLIMTYAKDIERKEKMIRNKNQEVETLLRVLIHDIANPLTIAMGYMRQEKLNKERITKSLTSINNIIHDVKRLKAVEDGKVKFELKEHKLANILTQAADNFTEKIRDKKIKLHLECHNGDTIITDKSILVNNILANLLSNAIKFTKEKGQITLKAKVDSRVVHLSVSDNGLGIPPEIRDKLFETNEVTSKPGTAGEVGTGFGLPIVKKLTELMGGNISLESNYRPSQGDSGTTFTLSFPKNLNV